MVMVVVFMVVVFVDGHGDERRAERKEGRHAEVLTKQCFALASCGCGCESRGCAVRIVDADVMQVARHVDLDLDFIPYNDQALSRATQCY